MQTCSCFACKTADGVSESNLRGSSETRIRPRPQRGPLVGSGAEPRAHSAAFFCELFFGHKEKWGLVIDFEAKAHTPQVPSKNSGFRSLHRGGAIAHLSFRPSRTPVPTGLGATRRSGCVNIVRTIEISNHPPPNPLP